MKRKITLLLSSFSLMSCFHNADEEAVPEPEPVYSSVTLWDGKANPPRMIYLERNSFIAPNIPATETTQPDGSTLLSWEKLKKPAGADDQFFTSDDNVAMYWTKSLDANNQVLDEYRYVGKGLDGLWYTDDDVLDLKVERESTAEYSLEKNSSPGADGVWGNNDDLFRARYTPNAPEDALSRTVTLSSLGADGVPMTSDDVIYSYDEERMISANEKLTFSDARAGVDQLFFTEDDTIKSYTLTQQSAGITTVTEYGKSYSEEDPSSAVILSDVGNGEHILAYSITIERAEGFTDFAYAINPGVDGIWFTLDDFSGFSRTKYVKDSESLVRYDYVALYTGPIDGEEGVDVTLSKDYWVEGQFSKKTLVAGNVSVDHLFLNKSILHASKGVDAQWLTADDVVDSFPPVEKEYSLEVSPRQIEVRDVFYGRRIFIYDETTPDAVLESELKAVLHQLDHYWTLSQF